MAMKLGGMTDWVGTALDHTDIIARIHTVMDTEILMGIAIITVASATVAGKA